MDILLIEIVEKPNMLNFVTVIILLLISLLIIVFLTTIFLDGKSLVIIFLVGITSVTGLAYHADVTNKYVSIHAIANIDAVRELEANGWKIVENNGDYYIFEKDISVIK